MGNGALASHGAGAGRDTGLCRLAMGVQRCLCHVVGCLYSLRGARREVVSIKRGSQIERTVVIRLAGLQMSRATRGYLHERSC